MPRLRVKGDGQYACDICDYKTRFSYSDPEEIPNIASKIKREHYLKMHEDLIGKTHKKSK